MAPSASPADSTSGPVSSLGTAAAGDLVYDTTNNALSVCNGTAWQTLTAGGSASGSTGYVQFNNGGAFGSDSAVYWDNTNKRLGIGTASPDGRLTIVSDNGTEAADDIIITTFSTNTSGPSHSNCE
jgi:hypothetical protein